MSYDATRSREVEETLVEAFASSPKLRAAVIAYFMQEDSKELNKLKLIQPPIESAVFERFMGAVDFRSRFVKLISKEPT